MNLANCRNLSITTDFADEPSLVTFFGRAKKVTRLPAGTGELGSGLEFDGYQGQRQDRGSRPAGRLTFYPSGHKK
jgi:hypothetical protein